MPWDDTSRYEEPDCNFCGSPAVFPDFRKMIIENARQNVKDTPFNLVECTVCHLRFFSPRPSWEYRKDLQWTWQNAVGQRKVALNHFTQGDLVNQVKDPEAQKAFLRRYYTDRFNVAKGIFEGKVPYSVFEVGGSVGWFSHVCQKSFGVPVLDGCEINSECVKIAVEMLDLPGHKAGDFNEWPVIREYEWVVMLDYIEHTQDPWTSLKKAYEMTRPGGLLLLKTFLEDLDVNRTMLAPPDHAYHFFGDVLYRMIRELGYRIKYWHVPDTMVFLVAQK